MAFSFHKGRQTWGELVKKMKSEDNLCALETLIKFCNVLAILPPHKLGVQTEKTPKWFKFYAGLMMVTIIASCVWTTYGKFAYLSEEYPAFVLIVDIIENILLTFSNTISIISLIYQKDNKVKKILNKIQQLDRCVTPLNCKPKQKFWKCMFFVQFGVLFIFSLDSIIWTTSLGWKWYQYYLSRNLQFYRFCCVLFLVTQFTDIIRERFKALNFILCTIVRDIKEDNGASLCYADFDNSREYNYIKTQYCELKNVSRWYHGLTDIVEDLNEVFGLILLSSVLFIIVICVHYIIMLILYSINTSTLDGVNFGMNLVFLCAVWVTMIMIFTIVLGHTCDSLAAEARRTSSVCYILLNDIPTIPKTERDHILKEELLLLAQQVNVHKPTIQASGFFSVNYSMIGFIVASITSYLIVSMQFLGVKI